MIDIVEVRLLGTGSRLLTDRALVHRALTDVVDELQDRDVCLQRGEILIVHGGQGYVDRRTGITKGADLLIDQDARSMGLSVKPVPARWRDPCRPECNHGPRKVNRFGQSYCQFAGFYRNQEMVDLCEYHRCITFPLGRSVGTRDCMRRAQAAGIGVVPYEARVVVP
jgi:hypothetical protein